MTPSGATHSASLRASVPRPSAGGERWPGSKRCAGRWPVCLLQYLAGNAGCGRPIETGGTTRASLTQRVTQRPVANHAFKTATNRVDVERIDDNASFANDLG